MAVAGGGVVERMSIVGKSVCVVSFDLGPRSEVGGGFDDGDKAGELELNVV